LEQNSDYLVLTGLEETETKSPDVAVPVKKKKRVTNTDKVEEVNCIKCDVCFKSFKYINSLLRHRKQLHRGDLVFRCTVCPYGTKVFLEFSGHLRKSHADDFKLAPYGLVCAICGKKFLSHDNLTSHMKFHKAPQFQCSYCNKMFKAKRSVIRHENKHIGSKSNICETCGKGFHGENDLINHKKIHEEKKFMCATCEKTFVTKWNLTQHERIHSNERPYKCPIPGCSDAFIQNFLLKAHLSKWHRRNWQDFKKPTRPYKLETIWPE